MFDLSKIFPLTDTLLKSKSTVQNPKIGHLFINGPKFLFISCIKTNQKQPISNFLSKNMKNLSKLDSDLRILI